MEDSLAKTGRLVSNKTGLIHEVVELGAQAQDAPLFFTVAVPANNGSFNVDRHPTSGYGSSFDRRKARVAAIAEYAERYCGHLHGRVEMLVRAPYAELKGAALNPLMLPLGSDREYERLGVDFPRFRDDLVMDWVWCSSIGQRRPILVPALAVFLFQPVVHPEERLFRPSSNGLACGATLEEAVLSGMLECIERDAIMITWLQRLPMPTISVESIADDRVAAVAATYSMINVRLVLKLLKMEHRIPVVLALAVDQAGDKPALACGASASLDPYWAVVKAIEELEMSRRFLYDSTMTEADVERARVEGQPHWHSHIFSDHSMLKHLDFLLDESALISVQDIPNASSVDVFEDIQMCRARLEQEGMEVLMTDITTRDLAEVGLWAVSIVIPGLQPICFGDGLRRLGGKRLHELPMRLGYLDRITTEDDLNPMPHFFP